MSKAANRPDFIKAMGSVKDVDEGVYKWLLENEPDQWSRHAFDTTTKSYHITNNMSECFNSWLGEDRKLPILSLLELYRCRVMKRSDEFEVDDENVNPCKTHVLVLGKQLCDCGMWQLSGIPCVHVIACLLHKNISNYEHYVDPKLRILMYLQTYAYMVHLVPDKTSWPEVSDEYIWPPYSQPKVGRPSKSRRKDPNEEPKSKRVSTLRCSVCSVLGHNKRSCKKNPANADERKKQKQTCPKLQVQGVNQVNNAMGKFFCLP
ncbi:hypothetical protein Pint_01510 [Pistacia integerrima]|uniref:Uncharacterized protein n=1 Tax=Pistacia integerrima TaxID=434235 RepID=A0ACC0ZII9_9ROSI|nr:hypothetical protein Pint_01510 [Pistacia integerrima]